MMAELRRTAGGMGARSGSHAELTKVQELVYELKVEQVMTRDVITCTPDQTMNELKEILRLNQISGVPIVEDGRMVGMISVESLIKALEQGEADHSIREKMTRQVQAVRADDSLAGADLAFARFKYGRFPVLNADGELVGILTQGDIVRGCSSILKRWAFGGDTALPGESHFRGYRVGADYADTALPRRRAGFTHGGEASSKVKRALERLGAHPQLIRRISVATYEAENKSDDTHSWW